MKAKFEIVKNFKIFAIISLVLIAPGLIGLITLPFGMNLFNMDIDFIGGTSMTFNVHQEVSAEMVNDEIPDLFKEATGIDPSSVQQTGDGESVIIKSTAIDTTKRAAVIDAMQEKYNLTDDDTMGVEDVNPTIGKEMQSKALIAACVAVICMLIYISIRFELTSGLAAVLCLIHDILVILSAYIILQIPFNTKFIAVALTILGYSINASVIMFDRVRENLKYARREKFEETVEKSIWQTLRRTINTSITTLLTISMIFIFGVSSLRQFTLPIIVGVVCGAYSSVFLSGPLWTILRRKFKKKKVR
ncbi:MAG: protein translocase subunit SecF [Butyricicoccaceae bacterium]